MPEWRTEILRRLAGAKLRPEREAEIVDEVAQHLDDRYRDKLAMGQTPAESELSAWSELDADGVLAAEIARTESPFVAASVPGGPEQPSFLAGLGQDFFYAIRRLSGRPLFCLTAIVTIALSVGPATAVLGVANGVFFTPRPGVASPDQLFMVQFLRNMNAGSFSPVFVQRQFVDEAGRKASGVAGMAGFQPLSAGVSANGAVPTRIAGQIVDPGYLELLGVRMKAGRPLDPEDDRGPGGVASVVLSEGLAADTYGSANAAIGKVVQLNSVPFTVVGVTDRAFDGINSPAKFWVTGSAGLRVRHFAENLWATFYDKRGPFNSYVVRLRPGTSYDSANQELLARTAATAGERPELKGLTFRVLPGLGAPASLNTLAVTITRLLAIVSGVLVLLGMANMANLLIFRGLKLGREVAIRKALGASVARLVQLTLVESLLLAAAGAAAGIGVALGIEAMLGGLTVRGLGPITVAIDWRLLGATASLAIVTGIGFGVGPALIAARGSVLAALGRGVRSESRHVGRLRQALASTQLALSLMLLIGAILFLTTIRRLHDVDLGMDPANVTTLNVDLKSHGYDETRIFSYYRQLTDALAEQPGVERAAVAYSVPVTGITYSHEIFRQGHDRTTAQELIVNYVSSNYFDALRVPMWRGRGIGRDEEFVQADVPPIVLSRTVAEQVFGDEEPLGQIVLMPGRPDQRYVVVGVTGYSRWTSLQEKPEAIGYVPFAPGIAVSSGTIIVRSSRTADDVAKTVQAAAAAIDSAVPLFGAGSLQKTIDARLGPQILFAWVLGLLGAIGFALAAIGLHSLISQMVAERSREFGIRMAIGADARSVVALVARQGAVVAAIGVAVGLGASFLAGKLIQAQLFGVTSRDPFVYTGAASMLLVVVAIALVGPARAALGVQPISVLRSE